MQAGARCEGRRDRSGKRDFKTIEHPGNSERRRHERMKSSPRKTIETSRDTGFENLVGRVLHIFILTGRASHGTNPIAYCLGLLREEQFLAAPQWRQFWFNPPLTKICLDPASCQSLRMLQFTRTNPRCRWLYPCRVHQKFWSSIPASAA